MVHYVSIKNESKKKEVNVFFLRSSWSWYSIEKQCFWLLFLFLLLFRLKVTQPPCELTRISENLPAKGILFDISVPKATNFLFFLFLLIISCSLHVSIKSNHLVNKVFKKDDTETLIGDNSGKGYDCTVAICNKRRIL